MLFFNRFELRFFNEPWFVKMMLVLAATFVVHFVAKFILNRFIKLSQKTNGYWDDVLSHAGIKPLPVLVWVIGLYAASKIALPANDLNDYLENVKTLRDVGLTICFGWFFWRLIDDLNRKYIETHSQTEDIDHTTIDALSKLGFLIVMIATALAVMQTVGFSVSGILAAGGIGGIAVGFAAKDILANFFGGLTIYLDRPFSVGEWIRSPDKDIEGTVEMISWRHTRIRRFNKNPIYVPNAIFTTIAVENPSRMTNRRIKETIGIRYEDISKMQSIVRDVKVLLEAHPDIDQEQTLIVNFNTFNASSIDFFIYTFTKTKVWEEYHHVKQDVLLKVAKIIADHQAEIAFPTQTLHVENVNAENYK
jgi:MscS family membrane protein